MFNNFLPSSTNPNISVHLNKMQWKQSNSKLPQKTIIAPKKGLVATNQRMEKINKIKLMKSGCTSSETREMYLLCDFGHALHVIFCDLFRHHATNSQFQLQQRRPQPVVLTYREREKTAKGDKGEAEGAWRREEEERERY